MTTARLQPPSGLTLAPTVAVCCKAISVPRFYLGPVGNGCSGTEFVF